jgi:hypothetical protein
MRAAQTGSRAHHAGPDNPESFSAGRRSSQISSHPARLQTVYENSQRKELVGLNCTQVAKSPHSFLQFVTPGSQSPPQTCVSLGSGFSEALAAWKAAAHSRTARTVPNIFNILFM